MDTPNCKPLLIIDEIQHLAQSDHFYPRQGALRTAFDLHGDRLPVVYAGSSRSGIQAMFADDKMPFYNSAYMADFPTMGIELVRHCCNILKDRFGLSYDRQEVADIFARCFDHSPFWLSELIQQLVMHHFLATKTPQQCRQSPIPGHRSLPPAHQMPSRVRRLHAGP